MTTEPDDDMDLAAMALMLAGEFEQQAKRLLEPDSTAKTFTVTGMVFDETRAVRILHTPVPEHFELISCLAHTYRHRSRRVHAASQIARPMPKGWLHVLRVHYPDLLNGLVAVPDGWADLLFATISQIALTEQHVHVAHITEDFGRLRVFHDADIDSLAGQMFAAAATVSTAICQVCGTPGHYHEDGVGWVRTLCEIHKKEVEANEK